MDKSGMILFPKSRHAVNVVTKDFVEALGFYFKDTEKELKIFVVWIDINGQLNMGASNALKFTRDVAIGRSS